MEDNFNSTNFAKKWNVLARWPSGQRPKTTHLTESWQRIYFHVLLISVAAFILSRLLGHPRVRWVW